MSNINHTPGPWNAQNIFENWLIADSKDILIDIRGNEANAKRIVECVNAMEGVEKPATFIPLIKMKMQALEDERRSNALEGQAALDECNNTVVLLRKQISDIESLVSTFTSGLRGVVSEQAYADFWGKFNAITGTNNEEGGGQP